MTRFEFRILELFNSTGRIGRLTYIVRVVAGLILYVSNCLIVLSVTGQFSVNTSWEATVIAGVELMILSVFFIWYMCVCITLRQHDCDVPKLLIVLTFLVYPILLAFIPGTWTTNIHGPPINPSKAAPSFRQRTR